MIVKFITDCNFAGCSRERYIKFSKNQDPDSLSDILQDFIEGDIGPDGCYEIVDESEFDETELDDDWS